MSERAVIVHVVVRLAHGGLENGLVNLLNHEAMRDYDHVVFSVTDSTDFVRRIRRPDVRVIELNKPPGKSPLYLLRLFRHLRDLRPAIVHTRNFGSLECQLAAGAAGVPAKVHSEHGWDVDMRYVHGRRYRLIRRLLYGRVDRLIALSREIESYLTDRIGVPADKVVRITNGVDTERFAPASPTREAAVPGLRIGWVGRMEDVKDLPTLLQAFARARARTQEQLHLLLAGDGSRRQELEDLATRLGIRSAVRFMGMAEDVRQVYCDLDVFVLPSLREGISNTVLEAMASGVPCIATDVGGNSELVEDGVTGAIVAPGDAGAIASQLEWYAGNRECRSSQGRNARTRALADFSIDTMAERYCNVYKSLIVGS